MKIILPILFLLFSFPAFAQEAPKPPADLKERTALATEFHKVRPLRPQIDLTLDTLGEDLSEAAQKKYREDIRKVFNYKSVEDASIKAMAETFTPEELKAMIAYYSNPAGRSGAAKMGEYEAKLTPAVKTAMDAALVELKYPQK